MVRTLRKSVRNETSAMSFYAPRTILNQTITGSRRFAAQDWPTAARHLDLIRVMVSVNLAFGVVTIMIATLGRAFF